MKKIAVLGAGNGACSTAADLSLRGFPVTLYSRPGSKTLKAVEERGGLETTGLLGEGFVPVREVTTDLKQAIDHADVIMVVVPGKGHEHYARSLAPLLKDGQIVFLSPGHMGGGLHFQRILKEVAPRLKVKVAEVNMLPYGCRLIGPAKVWVYVKNMNLLFAAFPGKHAQELEKVILQLYPGIGIARNVLECGMNYWNAVIHVPGMVLTTGWVEFTKGDFFFYYQGITPAVGRAIEAVDRERVEGLVKLGLPKNTFMDLFYRSGYTTREGWASGSVYQAFQESEPNKTRKSPEDLNHRYLMEDGPYGILPMSEVCHLVGVSTPVMDALIHVASVGTGIDFREEGLTLAKMGLTGLKPKEIDAFLIEGP